MSFILYTNNPSQHHLVLYETDDIKLTVGDISMRRGKWEFNFQPVASQLKPAKHTELRAWANDQVKIMDLTLRMLK